MKEKIKAHITILDYGRTYATIIAGRWVIKSNHFSTPAVAKNQIKKFCQKHNYILDGEIKEG